MNQLGRDRTTERAEHGVEVWMQSVEELRREWVVHGNLK